MICELFELRLSVVGLPATVELFESFDEAVTATLERGFDKGSVVDLETGDTIFEFFTVKNGRPVWWATLTGDLYEVNDVGGLNLVPENELAA